MSAAAGPRIGFLGTGLIATFHSKLLRAAGDTFVRSGAYDPDRARAEAFGAASGTPVLDDETAVLDASDAVYVCTWTSEHPRLVSEAARRGVHVFCEKPLAVDLAGAHRMLETVTAAGIVHQVGLILRRSPAFLLARALVRDPAAGPVFAVVFRDDQYLPIQGRYGSQWRSDRTRAGAGTLLEHSIHDVDLLRFLVGEVDQVAAQTANHHGHDGIEDVVVATLRFDSGALGTLTSVWHDNLARPSLRRVEVLCANRHVVVDGHDWFGPVTWTDGDGTTTELRDAELVDRAASLLDNGRSANPDADFVADVAAGRPADPDMSVAVAAHRIVDAMYRSAADRGRPVTIGDR